MTTDSAKSIENHGAIKNSDHAALLNVPDDFERWPIEAQFRFLWVLEARPNQLTPLGPWRVWFIKAGRGFGKTRAGVEDVSDYGLTMPDRRIAVVARTLDDVRDTCVEGESGLLTTIPTTRVRKWNRSQGDLYLTNGTKFEGYSSAVPDSLRGPQFHRALCEELAAWLYLRRTWNNLMLGLRLGDNPQAIVTSTPRPLKLVKELVERSKGPNADVVLSEGSTYENIENLAPTFREEILARFEGTRLGQQELHGKVLDDAPGSLWKRDGIEATRWKKDKDLPDMDRIIIGVDPAVTSGETANETGIVAVGVKYRNCPCGLLPHLPHGFVLDDRSLRATPTEWAQRSIDTYRDLDADRIVGEVNNGGELVETVIRSLDSSVSYKSVHASRGKKKRAEPVAALTEQKRFHFVGSFEELEDQCCTWEPIPDEEEEPDESDIDSPDRMDAMVWAATEAVLGPQRRKLRVRA